MTADASWGTMFYYWGAAYHSSTDPTRNSTWGEEADLDMYMAKMKTKFVDHGIPVVMGEFGAMRRTGTLSGANLTLNLNSRLHYLNYASRKAVANGMLPFYWDEGGTGNNSMGLYNRAANTVFDQAGIDALILGANGQSNGL
jgi:endoglucanase